MELEDWKSDLKIEDDIKISCTNKVYNQKFKNIQYYHWFQHYVSQNSQFGEGFPSVLGCYLKQEQVVSKDS